MDKELLKVKIELDNMKKLIEASECLLQMKSEHIDYQKITDDFVDITGAKFGAFNLYDEDVTFYRTVASSGDMGIINHAIKILGYNLNDKKWAHDIQREAKIRDKTITRFRTLYDLAESIVPRPVVFSIEELTGVGETVLIKIMVGTKIIGDFVILMNKGQLFEKENAALIYTRQVGILITRERTAGQLSECKVTFQALFEKGPIGVAYHQMIYDKKGKPVDYLFLDANESYFKLTGVNPVGKMATEAFPGLEKDPNDWIGKFGNVAKEGKEVRFQQYLESNQRWYDCVAYQYKPDHFVAAFLEITEQKIAQEILIKNEEKYRLITENITDVVSVLNLTKGITTYVSPSIYNLRGITWEEAMVEKLEEAMTPDSVQQVTNAIYKNSKAFKVKGVSKNHISEVQMKHKNGDIIWVEIAAKYRFNEDDEVELVCLLRNIEERKKAENKVLYLSYYDHLTGLYNRRFYEEELKRLDIPRNLPMALVMADVNGLKLTNDAFGHQAGDALLINASNILKNQCRGDEIVSRIGGDEFVILVPKTTKNQALSLMERIHGELSRAETGTNLLSVSMGMAVKTEPKQKMNELFKEAEDHMYRQKLAEGSSMRSKTIELIMNSLFAKNNREMFHSKRVGEICRDIAEQLDFTKDDVNKIGMAGLMHDIGKIGISDSVLNKEGKLTQEEWNEIKRHSEIGYRILSSVNEFSEIAEYVLSHHEKIDGTGYPKGVEGEEIPLESRIIGLADAYDAMTSERTYGVQLTQEEAVAELIKCSGTQFDKDLVKLFIEKVLKL